MAGSGPEMTSIFNSYYSQNLRRLNSSTAPSDSTAANNPEHSEKFARVLADLEQPKKTPNNPGELNHGRSDGENPPNLAGPPAEVLSNMTTSEASPSQAIPLVNPNLVMDHKTPAPESLLKSVNFTPDSVNFLAPDTVSTPIALPVPAKPAFAEIKRYESVQQPLGVPSTRGKPQTPKLASAERIAPTRAPLIPTRTDGDPIKDIIATAGKFYGIDPNLGMAIAQAESSFDPEAVSSDGHASKGIFQLLDSTGKHMMGHTGLDESYDPFDPAQNTYLGVGYLRRLHDIFSVETNLGGNIRTVPAGSAQHLEKLAVAAFNAGEGNVARAQARARALGKDPADFDAIEPYLPASTRSYVKKVTRLRETFAQRDPASKIA